MGNSEDINLPEDFDPVEYLSLNPDVRMAGIQAETHWKKHGHKEGRKYKRSSRVFERSNHDTDSFGKLLSFKLPDLANKDFLDLSCSEGFFVGWAHFSGANKSVGLDSNRRFINYAKQKFPQCEFLIQDYEQPINDKFDVILMASALNHSKNPESSIKNAMSMLKPSGIFILELEILRSTKTGWRLIPRDQDIVTYPEGFELYRLTRENKWAMQMVGNTAMQLGGETRRTVVHLSLPRKRAFIIFGSPMSGKTSLSRNIFSDSGPISVDKVIVNYKTGTEQPKFESSINEARSKGDLLRFYLDASKDPEILETILRICLTQASPNKDLVIEGAFSPSDFPRIEEFFYAAGFAPCLVHPSNPAQKVQNDPNLEEKLDSYREYLSGRVSFYN
jgi:SAM-dependent methyltransferase